MPSCASFSLLMIGRQSLCSGVEGIMPRHEFIDACGGMACCDGFKRCLEIGVWLDVVELASLDQGGDARPCATTLIMAREQSVLAIEGNRADRALNNVCNP